MTRFLALVLTASFSSVSAFATTLEFDLTAEASRGRDLVKVDIAKLNKALKAKGLEGLPERVIVSENPKPYGKLLNKRIEAINEAMPNRHHFPIDGGYLYEYPAICYRGEAADVPRIINRMLGTFLTAEQGILAMRYGEVKIIEDDNFKSEKALNEAYEGGNADTRAWLKFNTRSNAVLVMSNLGAQGDGLELYATSIKPCR